MNSRYGIVISIQLYTITGQNIIEKNSLNTEKYGIDIRNLSNGAYLIKVQTIQGIEVLPFFKQ